MMYTIWWHIVSYSTTSCEVVTAEEKAQTSQQTETATVNKLLDSYTSGDIYRCIHPLRTSAAFDKWRKNFFKCKTAYHAKVTPSMHLGPNNVSASWSSCIVTTAVSANDLHQRPS